MKKPMLCLAVLGVFLASACVPSRESTAEPAAKVVPAEEAMKSELGVAKAAFAALKANDHKAFAALMRPDIGMGRSITSGLGAQGNSQPENQISEEERVAFEKEYGFRPEHYRDSDFPKLAELDAKAMFAFYHDFETRIKTLGKMKKTKFKKNRGQHYEVRLPDGALVKIAVLKADDGRFCLGDFDIDAWHGPQVGEDDEAVSEKSDSPTPAKTE